MKCNVLSLVWFSRLASDELASPVRTHLVTSVAYDQPVDHPHAAPPGISGGGIDEAGTTEYDPLVSDEPERAPIMAASAQQHFALPDSVDKD